MDRERLLGRWKADIDAKGRAYTEELAGLQAASANETKSSAGDKYETAREMLAQTRRIIERNASETEELRVGLETMLQGQGDGPIHFGSLLRLESGWYLVGLNLGAFECDGIEVQGLSLHSPLGMALKGKRQGESFPWRGKTLTILAVVESEAKRETGAE